jgi:hypothetical protein
MAGRYLLEMPVALPDAADVNLAPPGAEEVATLSRGILGVVSPPGGLTDLQRVLIEAAFPAMTGFPPDLDGEPIDVADFALALARRDAQFRARIVQMVILFALVLRPLPESVVERAAAFAAEVGVDEGMLTVARDFAVGSLGLAAIDFERNGYGSDWHPDDQAALHTSTQLHGAWDVAYRDPVLATRWQALEDLGPSTLGRRMTDFYRARGFVYPGLPGSAPPLLTQHDWVHVVADYGTTVEAELEVFAFIARANDDVRAFSLLAMVVSLFETGYLRSGAGLFEYDSGHLSQAGVAVRLADALSRGARCQGSNDFMAIDWFSLAHLPIEEVRRHFGVPTKGAEALAAGSVGPWEPGGISPFQRDAGEALAAREGRTYDSFGASVA